MAMRIVASTIYFLSFPLTCLVNVAVGNGDGKIRKVLANQGSFRDLRYTGTDSDGACFIFAIGILLKRLDAMLLFSSLCAMYASVR